MRKEANQEDRAKGGVPELKRRGTGRQKRKKLEVWVVKGQNSTRFCCSEQIEVNKDKAAFSAHHPPPIHNRVEELIHIGAEERAIAQGKTCLIFQYSPLLILSTHTAERMSSRPWLIHNVR